MAIHKGLAVIALAIDALLSGVSFFYEMEAKTNSVGTVQLPPVIVVVAGAVLFNVAMSILSHLIPAVPGSYIGPRLHDGPTYVREHHPARLEQRSTAHAEPDERGPGLIARTTASFIATGQDVLELAREKRQTRKEEPVSLSHDDDTETSNPSGLKRPLPASSVSQPSNPSEAPSD
jgi:hypothetical protein